MSAKNIPATTEAVVFTEPGKVEVQEIGLPTPGPEDVLVDIEYTSISIGTERWGLLGKLRQSATAEPLSFPHIPGYQAAGSVRAVGDKVTQVRPGDRVFSMRSLVSPDGPDTFWGGHIRHHLTHQDSVMKLPDNVSTQQAAGLLLAQVGYNGASRPKINQGDVAVVIGDGQVGQYAAQVFRHRGAHVILSGRHENRLDLAKKYGAHEVFNSREADFPAWINEKYPDGVDIVAETASRREMIKTSTDMLKYEGQLVLLGYYPEEECQMDINWVRRKEITIHCPNAQSVPRMQKTLELISQEAMHSAELVTHTLPYKDAPEAYDMVLEKSADFLGILLDWRG